MQPNTITNPAIEKFSTEGDHTIYHAVGHTDQLRDMVELHRYNPKVSGSSLGSRRSLVKATLDVSVPTTTVGEERVAPVVARLEVSVPVGATPLEVQAAVLKIIDFIISDSIQTQIPALSYDNAGSGDSGVWVDNPVCDLFAKGEI